jgi:hypothetical protein
MVSLGPVNGRSPFPPPPVLPSSPPPTAIVEGLARLAVVVGIQVVDVVGRAAPVGLEVGLGLGLAAEVGTVFVGVLGQRRRGGR